MNINDKIDKRIVEMSFENSKFEKGIKQSRNSLNAFAEELDKSSLNKNFLGLTSVVTGLSSNFSALEQVAIGALRRIGSEAITAGANLIKSLTIAPISQGFQELELKTDSVKTIMASTGETLKTVNNYLAELNEYSDKTIYSFSDMTQNISKFTNAGVKLDLAVSSIKGIANAAAVSGANANEASRAMYNFAQALSSGNVKLVDWKSIELANMATVEFKQELIDSAVAAGTLEKASDGLYTVLSHRAGSNGMAEPISTTKNFNESLNEQWLTTEVLTKTLARYSDETTEIGRKAINAATQVTSLTKLLDTLRESVGSGWAQTFELIFGDFEQAKKLWTGINNAIGATIDKMSDARNALLKGGLGEFIKGQMTGRENLIEGLKNVVIGFLQVIKPISEAWDSIFPPTTIQHLYEMTEGFKNFTAQLRLSDENAKNLKRTFSGVFAVFDIIKTGLRFILDAGLNIINTFIPLGDSILEVTANIGDFVVGIANAFKKSQILQYGLLGIKIGAMVLKSVLINAYNAITTFVKGLMESTNPIEYLIGVLGGLGDVLTNVYNFVKSKLSIVIQKISTMFGLFKTSNYKGTNNIAKVFKTLGTNISNFVVPGFQKLKDILSKITFDKIVNFVVGATLLTLVWQISKAIGGFSNLTQSAGRFLDVLSKKFKQNTTLRDLAIAMGVLTASIWVLSTMPADQIYRGLVRVALGLGVLVGAFAAIRVIDKKIPFLGDKKKGGLSTSLLSIGAGLLSMIAVFAILGKIKSSTITNALPNLILLTSIMVGIEVLFGFAARIAKGNKLKIASLTGSMLGMVALVGILSLIPEETVNKGLKSLIKITAIISAIQVITALTARLSGGIAFKQSLIQTTIALTGMVGLVAILSAFSDDQFNRGYGNLAKLVGLMTAMQVVSSLSAKFGQAKTSFMQMIGVTTIILALTGSLMLLASVDQTALAKASESFSKVITTAGIFAAGMGLFLTVLTKMSKTTVSIVGIIKSLGVSLLATVSLFGTMILFFKGAKLLLNDVKNISWDDMKKLGAGLAVVSALFVGISLMSVPLGALMGVGIIPMLLGVIGVLAAVGLVVGGFIGLAYLINKLDADTLIAAFDKLALVGTGIGNFFGSILGGFSGAALEEAGKGISALFKSIENIKPESVSVIGDLAGAFLKMSFTRGSAVNGFAKQINSLITEVSSIDTSNITKATNNLDLMQPMVTNLTSFIEVADKIPNSGFSFASIFVGDNKIDDFVKQLTKMIESFNTITTNEIVRAIHAADNISLMIQSLTNLSNFSDTLENSGGLKQLFSGNTTLKEFGKEIKGLVNNLSDISKKELTNAKNNVNDIIKLLNKLKEISDFDGELSPITSPNYISSIDAMLKGSKNKILSYEKPFITASDKLVTGLKTPFDNSKSSWIEIGEWIPKSIANGIDNNKYLLSSSGIKMAEDTEESIRNTMGIHSESKEYASIGEWISKSIANGIGYAKKYLLDTAEKCGIDTGNLTTEGISKALGNSNGAITQGIQAMLDKLLGNSKDDLLSGGSTAGDSFTSGFQESLSDSISGIGGSDTANIIKTELEKIQDYIEEEKYYGRMSLQEELAEYLKIQSKYAIGSEERKKIDREVYRLQKEIYEASKKYVEESIKAKKEASETMLALEKTYNENVNQANKDREAEHTQIVEDAEAQRQKVREEYAQKQKEINDNLNSEIKDLYDTYGDKLNSRTNSLVSSYGIFDEISTPENVSGDSLLKNLKDQVNLMDDWDKSITELASRGIGDGLINELQKMGPSATQQIKGLLSLSDEKLTEYVKLYGDKYKLARTRAESELSIIKDSMPSIIKDMRENSKTELDLAKESFVSTMHEINNQMYDDLVMMNMNAKLKLDNLKTEFDSKVNEINTNLKNDLKTMKTNFDTSMKNIDDLSVKELEKLNKEFDTKIKSLNAQLDTNLSTTESTFAETGTAINTQATTVLNTLKGIYSSGAEAVSNLATGIVEKLPEAENAAKTLVEKVLNQMSIMVEQFRTIGAESASAYLDGLNAYGSVTGLSNLSGDDISKLSNSLAKTNSKAVTNMPNTYPVNTNNSNQNGSKTTEISYTQNNYSPKSLSRLDIYRSTKTQLATLKEAVN